MAHVLLFQLSVVADTLLVRQLPPERTAFEQVVFVTSGITTILLFGVLVLLLLAMIALKAKADDTRSKIDELLLEIKPLTKAGAEMADDLRVLAKNARAMAEESHETVTEVNERVRDTVGNLADRVDELSEMIGRINASANRVASVAGTAMGGLKAGVRMFGIGRKKGKKKKQSARARGTAERPRLRRRD